jgi:hypothetical protein
MSRALALVGVFTLAGCGLAGSNPPFDAAGATAAGRSHGSASNDSINYNYVTLDDGADPTFNEILGINNEGHVVGYYGSGSVSDPSHGYVVYPPYQQANFRGIAFPKASNTIATGLNNQKLVVGYYTEKGKTASFVYASGIWTSYQDPRARGNGTTTEFASVNDSDVAVGNYTTPSGQGAFQLNVGGEDYDGINPTQGTGAVVTGINGKGDVVGYVKDSGRDVGFIRKNGTYTYLIYPHAKSTRFLNVTAFDTICGSYVDKTGATHGFILISPLWKPGTTWQSIDDPNGIGSTVATSVNIHDDVVGYYTDSYGNVNGFLATPSSS